MDNLIFDTGIKEYLVNEGETLKFNPTDQNVYARFVEFYNEIGDITKEYDNAVKEHGKVGPDGEKELDEKGFETASKLMEISKKTDRTIKDRLTYVFGESNDFDKMLDGVNIMAMTDTGQMVIENFLDALLPIIETNAEKRKAIMDSKVESAVKKAQLNRAQRRAVAYGKVDASDNG
jgi:hypothetical protein